MLNRVGILDQDDKTVAHNENGQTNTRKSYNTPDNTESSIYNQRCNLGLQQVLYFLHVPDTEPLVELALVLCSS